MRHISSREGRISCQVTSDVKFPIDCGACDGGDNKKTGRENDPSRKGRNYLNYLKHYLGTALVTVVCSSQVVCNSCLLVDQSKPRCLRKEYHQMYVHYLVFFL